AVAATPPALAATDADHAVTAIATDEQAGKQKWLHVPGREVGAAVAQPFLDAPEVVRRDDGLVGAGYADAEPLIGAHVGAVAQDVADADHAPGPATARAQALLVQAP